MGILSAVMVTTITLARCIGGTDLDTAKRNLRAPSNSSPKQRLLKTRKGSKCDPTKIELADFNQWEKETGYWIGEYSLYGSDGGFFKSSSWNYPYGSYKGFITGNVKDNKYRQRNIFVYPPQEASICNTVSKVTGVGICGVNGNTKVFQADQAASICERNPAYMGDIEGDYGASFYTTTELVGRREDNAVLYQVFLKAGQFGLYQEDKLLQSQLTTLTESLDGLQQYRTRSAQSFNIFTPTNFGKPSSVSFYRERKVSKEEFYVALESAFTEYNILTSDMCAWNDQGIPSGYTPGPEACKNHLEQSFEL